MRIMSHAQEVCATEHHEQIKLDPTAWSKLEYVGIQEFDDGGPWLELRNCTCGGTLAIEIPAGAKVEAA